MVFTVIAEVVSGGEDRLDIVRVFVDPFAGHEKGDVDLIFCKNIEDVSGIFITPSCIKAECNLLFIGLDAVDRELFYGCSGLAHFGRSMYGGKQEKGQGKTEKAVSYDTVDFGWIFVEIHGLPQKQMLRILYDAPLNFIRRNLGTFLSFGERVCSLAYENVGNVGIMSVYLERMSVIRYNIVTRRTGYGIH